MSRYSEYRVWIPVECENEFRDFVAELSNDSAYEWMGWTEE